MVKRMTSEDKERIRAAVQAAERTTAGEIRVSIVPHSARPNLWLGGLVTIAVSAAVFAWRGHEAWGLTSGIDVVIALGIGTALGALLGWLPALPRSARSVRRRAEREFVRLGIAQTAGRTGVLLLLSMAERRAVLLADRAINEKVAQETWDKVIGDLVASIGQEKTADGLIQAVGSVGRILSEHFPRRPDDVNELPDDVAGG